MKLKTHKGTKKRVRRTGTGKFVWQKAAKRHLLINKNRRQKNLNPRGVVAAPGEVEKLEKLLPY